MSNVCPDCGGYKGEKSKRCRTCSNKSPERRAAQSKTLLRLHATTDSWNNVSDKLKEDHKTRNYKEIYTKEVRKKISDKHKAYCKQPGIRERMAELQRAAWQNSEYLNSEEYRRKCSEGQNAFWDTPEGEEWKQKESARLKSFYASPDGKAARRKLSKIQKARWTPELRKRVSKKLRLAWRNGAFDNRVVIPSHPTSIELEVTGALDKFGLRHTSQWSPDNYYKIYDEFIYPNILVEVQGSYWHSAKEQQDKDLEKARWAHSNGYKFIAIWDFQLEEYGVDFLVEKWILPLNPERDTEEHYYMSRLF